MTAMHKGRRPIIEWILTLLLFLLAGCTGSDRAPSPPITEPAPDVLNVGLSSSAETLADTVTAAYANHTDRAIVNFIAGNNEALFQDLEAGELEAILVHHVPEGKEVWFNPVALDGLAVVVHPANPLQSLTLGQIQGLFSGQIDDWSGIGGSNTPVTVIGRERNAGARIIFERRVMGAQRVDINTLIQSSNQALLDAVAAEPAAIGYAMMNSTTDDVAVVAIDGMAPTPENTATQDYPLTVPLYFVSPAEPEGQLRALLAWLQSPSGQAVLGEKFGRVN